MQREHSSRPHQCAAEKLCGNCASRCGLAADAKLLVALLTVSADWQHAGLHVRSIGEAVVHSASCGAYCAVHTCGCIVAGAADAAGFAGTANEALSVAWFVADEDHQKREGGMPCAVAVGAGDV